MTVHPYQLFLPAVRRLLPGIAALAGALSPLAAPAQQPAAEGAALAAKGNAQGASACASCHGAKGEGAGTFPRLAGTGQAYLLAQLQAFASGERASPVMQPIAKALSPREQASVAGYYAGLPPPLRAADAAQPKPADIGAWLATRGRWSDDLPACAQCHGPGGNGVGSQFPPLAGLPAAYIADQLRAWKAGQRPPGPLGLMELVARKLSDAEVQAVSSYYAGLGAGQAAAAPAAKEQR